MEERIATAESRGAVSGLGLQGFLDVLQTKGSKFQPKSSTFAQETQSEESNVSNASQTQEQVNLETSETWKSNLFLAPKRLQARWEQYSPSFRDKIQKYSPNPIKKIKELFSQPEGKYSEEQVFENLTEEIKLAGEKEDNDVEAMEDDKNRAEILQERQNKYKRIAAFCLDEKKEADKEKNSHPCDDSSQKERVPSNQSSFAECDIDILPESSPSMILCSDQPPSIVLQEPDSAPADHHLINLESEVLRRGKSPITVQEWVDHLPSKPKITDKDCEDSSGSKESDNVALTADVPILEDKRSLAATRLSREASLQSSSSLDSLLGSRRPDPVEVLLNLGFGGVPGVDLENCRIPKRFLVPSKCKGGDWNEFLRRELLQVQNFECASLGFRGLSGPSYQRPSAIVANIIEKLRERVTPRPPAKSRFSTVARRILNEKSVLNKLAPESQSVLSPDNRKFLESQGKISPEVPRRRIIFGEKSFAFANDGEFVEVEPSAPREVLHKDSTTSLGTSTSAESDSEENKPKPAVLRSPESLLKLRRSSLQRQKKIEADDEEIDLQQHSCGTNHSPMQRPEKIPHRFVPSGNLKVVLEKDKSPEEIRRELEEEIQTLSEKIRYTKSNELTSILLQIKELRSRLDSQ